MLTLTIDIGNSEIKTGLVDESLNIIAAFRTTYKKQEVSEVLNSIVKDSKGHDEVWITVSNKEIGSELSGKFTEFNFVGKHTELPFEVEYDSTPGYDRLCTMAGSLTYKKDPVLTVDLGTATTLNLIVDNNFIGGLIIPGIKTGLDYLASKTGLPCPEFGKEFSHIGTDTNSSILNGVYNLNRYGLSEIIKEYKKNYPGLFVIITGGMNFLFSKEDLNVDCIDENLSLKGLKLIATIDENSN